MRTTFDVDDVILEEVKALQVKEGRSMSALVSELLADALARRHAGSKPPAFRWITQPMRAMIDLADKDALYAVLDSDSK